MLIEYADVDQRQRELARLIGVEDKVWVQGGALRARVPRSRTRQTRNDSKTSSGCTSCASSSTPG